MVIAAGSLDIPKFKQLDVNSSVQSPYQAQGRINLIIMGWLHGLLNDSNEHILKAKIKL